MKLIAYLLAGFSALALHPACALDYTLELSQEQIQQAVQARMPVKVQQMFSTLTLSNPTVILQENSDRLGVETDLLFNIGGAATGKGRGLIDGNIVFVREKGEFHLTDPQIRSLKIDGVSPQLQEPIRQLADSAAKQALAAKPIYTLDDADLKQKLAKAVLKSVAVQGGKLALFLQF